VETKGGIIGRRIRAVLSPDLLSKQWAGRLTGIHPVEGHCYIAAEAFYHLAGGKKAGMSPRVISKEDWTHWYVVDKVGNIYDPTRDQFKGRPPYEEGRGSGFLTKKPSRRARIIMERIGVKRDGRPRIIEPRTGRGAARRSPATPLKGARS